MHSQSNHDHTRLAQLDALAEHLTSLSENSMFRIVDLESKLLIAYEPTTELIHNGIRFDPEEAYIHGNEFGTCSETCCELIESTDTLYRGYALLCGEWFPHTWLIDENGLLAEPCTTMCDTYIGLPINENKLNEFISEFK